MNISHKTGKWKTLGYTAIYFSTVQDEAAAEEGRKLVKQMHLCQHVLLPCVNKY